MSRDLTAPDSTARIVPSYVSERQYLASNPANSAWVSAHAGSGKTHVLTQRVVRLLLDGVHPARLTCLTFTKAAAANMAQRVFATLAQWTLLDDADLRVAIAKTGAKPSVNSGDLDTARQLFARAVETPGGLKIQTIHAFCERLLHLFPFEANTPADFRVVEESERQDILLEARQRILAEAGDDPILAQALALVADNTSDTGFAALIDEILSYRDLLADDPALLTRLPAALGLDPGETQESLEREILFGGIPPSEWPDIAQAMALGGKTDQTQAENFLRAAALAPGSASIDIYCAIFFTQAGTLRKSVATAAIKKIAPDLPERLLLEGQRLAGLLDKLLAAATVARTEALALIARAILQRYGAMKQMRGLLDFDDLIQRTRALLLRSGASSWILYKLDGGIDHILVDEAQDTSEAQWDILAALAAEFTVGASAARSGGTGGGRNRTFFAVGDEKQSIFSFQGAAPAAFGRMRKAFQKRSEDAQKPFFPVQLDLSFRSAPLILDSVDKVFSSDKARRGLNADPLEPAMRHNALKSDVAGLVEIWAPELAGPEPDDDQWALSVDLPRANNPASNLAQRIAAKIAGLIAPDSCERLVGPTPGSLRRINPNDIMILVRRRGPFFDAMVRALKESHVPVAGADRLNVAENIAVMDLIACARAALLPDDDLTLAVVLKSPLLGLDDNDLLDLAPERAGSLWQALERSGDPRHIQTIERLKNWRGLAEKIRPFDFFSRLLGVEGGRKAFRERIGPEADDALDELLALALAHERHVAPSLAAFAHQIETLDLTIKRDMEAAGDQVRVMTVHAAKGLEANIVFLPDTATAPTGAHDPSLFTLQTPAGPDNGPTLAWSPGKNTDPSALSLRRESIRAEADDEYRRLLYVALTRAEQRLYIAAYAGIRGLAAGCWYEIVHAALQPDMVEMANPDDSNMLIWRLGAPLMAASPEHSRRKAGEAACLTSQTDIALPASSSSSNPILPDWLSAPARQEQEPAPPLRPSSALNGADAARLLQPDEGGIDNGAPIAWSDMAAANTATANMAALRRGVLIHALLEALPNLAPDLRAEAAGRFLRAREPGWDEAAVAKIIAEVLAVLALPEAAPLFGPRSRGEVILSANLPRENKAPLAILGRIDRLAEIDSDGASPEIWIVDFKTGAAPADAGQDNVTQLALYRAAAAALYPARVIRAFLLWTSGPKLQEIAPERMDLAVAAL